MTHPNFPTNGASLEDCHTNFFALMDLCGIKWRRLSAENVPYVDPLDDPVLLSFSKCLAADILCVWRRVPSSCSVPHRNYIDIHTQPLLHKKELWIFWYGNEPDLTNILCSGLPEIEQGSWENGLSYECRTLLFKAIHNRIERSLLSRDYVRLGKWFVQPCDVLEKPIKSPHSLSFNFFIHGESTVCASVDVREHPLVRKLTQQHLLSSQGSQSGVQVILGPYGQSGILTGHIFKDSDVAIQKLLEEWRQFFPVDAKLGCGIRDGGSTDSTPSIPAFVEVIVGGVKLRYPSCYVLVVDTDKQSQDTVGQCASMPGITSATCSSSGTAVVPGTVSSVSLTPPTSPCDPTLLAGGSSRIPSAANVGCLPNAGIHGAQGLESSRLELLERHSWESPCRRIVSDVCQDSAVTAPVARTSQSGSGQADDAISSWDFNEPTQKAPCAFLKCKKVRQGSASSKSTSGGVNFSSGSTGASGKKPDRSEKSDKQQPRHLRSMTPFHRRMLTVCEDVAVFDSDAVKKQLLTTSTAFQFKSGVCPRASTPSGLPLIRTNALEPPASVGSPVSAAPSPLVSSHSQPSSVAAQQDSNMPTLSPHPSLQRGDVEHSERAEVQSESQDASQLANSKAQTPQEADKDGTKSAMEQVLSPFPSHGSEPPKSVDNQPSTANTAAATTPTSQCAAVSSKANTMPLSVQELQSAPLKRPILPTNNYEELDDDEPATDSLYDYSCLHAWLQHPVKKFKPEPKFEHCPNYRRASIGDNLPSPSTAPFKKDPVTPQMPLDHDMVSPKPADPYEFVDDFPTTVSMAGFKSKNETGKDEDKAKDVSQSGVVATDGPTTAVASKEPKTSTSLDSSSSPPTPKAISTTTSLFREKDLVATYEDLDQLFDTSDDDTNNDAFQPPNSPGSSKAFSLMDDGTPVKTNKTTSGIGILGPTELSRMFPTPPSLEQASPCGPVNGSDSANLEGGDTAMVSIRDRSDMYPNYDSPSDESSMDWSYVFKPSPISKFVGSSKYAPMANLPSQLLPPVTLPAHCVYRPSWQHSLSVWDKMIPASHVSALSSVESMDRMHGSVGRSMEPSPATFVNSVEPRLSQSFELQSPASNASSYLNKNLNSVDDGVCGGNISTHVPEAHSLLVNLLLSDSLLNIFKDHNFDSSTMCVCHMNIKGSDMGTYLPDLGSPSEEPSYKCTCGFSAVINRRYGYQSGLFYEDEVEITGLRNELIDKRKSNLLVLEPEKEASLMSAALNNPAIKASLDPTPPCLLELLKVQCTTIAASSCNILYKSLLAYHHLQQGASLRGGQQSSSSPTTTTTTNSSSIMATISSVVAGCATSNGVPVTVPVAVPHQLQNLSALDVSTSLSVIEILDGCEVTVAALEQGRQALDNLCGMNRLDENLKVTVLHRWPFLKAKLPSNNQDLVRLLRALQPLLQEAVHKKPSTQFWEATTTATYTVSGPLTWRQFLKLAGRSTEDQCEPQPIPSLLVGYDKDWLALSPFAIKYWEKLLLEPYSLSRDVAYIVIAPDNSFILSNVTTFFRELSGTYEVCRLGRHRPITKVLKDGIMRVGKSAAKNLAEQLVDEWFNLIGDSPIATKLKLYAQVCKHHLAPHLSTQPLDNTLLESHQMARVPEKVVPAASPMPPLTPETIEKDRVPTPKPIDPNDCGDSSNQGMTKDVPSSSSGSSANNQDPYEQEDDSQAPAVVIYMVDPFTYCSDNPEMHRLATLGLLRCYVEMLKALPESMQNSINLQIVPLESIMEHTTNNDRCKHSDQLKSLAFSVFAQCRRTLVHQSTVKSLTGFGPASAVEMFLKNKDERNSAPYRMFSPPYILAPMKDKQTQLTESFGDHRERATVLYCTYCLSEDQRWLLASCTDDRGEILDTCVISIEIPNRNRRKKASARKSGLQKLMDWILGVMSTAAVVPWRLVVGRMGRLGHGELRGWSNLLCKKTLQRASKHLKEMCKQCQYMNLQDTPCILSACLVSLEADSSLRVMSDQFTPDEFFSSSSNSCDLSTPQDASCTHILVFPTSATTQSSQATYQQDPIDALGPNLKEEDILSALDEEGHTMTDINAIFDWADTSPGQSPVDSPRRECSSRPGSPGLGISDRQSPFQNGAFSRGVDDYTGDPQEEAPQLQQQPLALGYYVSTAKTGPLPKWFWSSCSHLENVCPAFLRSALHIHSPTVQQSSDDLFQQQSHLHSYHPLDSNFTTDVLRYVLEGYNALSWLAVDPVTHDRRSCLPVHIQVLMQMYYATAALV